MKKINCIVFDDHPLVCSAVEALIADLSCIESVESMSDAVSVIKRVKEQTVDLLILDIGLADCDGYDFYRRVKSHDYKGKVLFYSAQQSQLYSEMAYKMGADGYVCKSEDPHILKDAVEGIVNGYTFFKSEGSFKDRNSHASLSTRETIVMNYLLQGKTNKEIAEILSISDKTISTYKRRIMDKFNVKNVIELTQALSKPL